MAAIKVLAVERGCHMSVHLRHVAHVGHVGILSWLRLTPVGGSTIESNWMMMTPQKGCGVFFWVRRRHSPRGIQGYFANSCGTWIRASERFTTFVWCFCNDLAAEMQIPWRFFMHLRWPWNAKWAKIATRFPSSQAPPEKYAKTGLGWTTCRRLVLQVHFLSFSVAPAMKNTVQFHFSFSPCFCQVAVLNILETLMYTRRYCQYICFFCHFESYYLGTCVQMAGPAAKADADFCTLRPRNKSSICWNSPSREFELPCQIAKLDWSTGRFIPEFTHQHGIGQKQLVLPLASVKKLLQISNNALTLNLSHVSHLTF